MAFDSRTDRAKVTFEHKAERARRFNATKTRRLNTRAAQRRAYREFGEFDA